MKIRRLLCSLVLSACLIGCQTLSRDSSRAALRQPTNVTQPKPQSTSAADRVTESKKADTEPTPPEAAGGLLVSHASKNDSLPEEPRNDSGAEDTPTPTDIELVSGQEAADELESKPLEDSQPEDQQTDDLKAEGTETKVAKPESQQPDLIDPSEQLPLELPPNDDATVDPEKTQPLDPPQLSPADADLLKELSKTEYGAPGGLQLSDVVQSVNQTFPLVRAAYEEARIAGGNQLAAWGSFDLKLKAESENGSPGFYQTYRQKAGFEQPLYDGGQVFGGYRIGRGSFEPWFRERQTNDGGELKTGVRIPLAKNRDIDSRRAALWRATYERELANPEIRQQVILFVRDGSLAYWKWIAAGQKVQIGRRALELSQTRVDQIESRVKRGDLAPPVLEDNRRSIAEREARLIDLERELEQSAVKLSLFFRAADGSPLIPDEDQLTAFPEPRPFDRTRLESDASLAVSRSPKLEAIGALSQVIGVDYNEAANEALPQIDAQFTGSQDMGKPTSKKRDKSRFELEAALYFEVPLQRRKARGKMIATGAKLAQLRAKREFVESKVIADVQAASIAISAAYDRVLKTRESLRLAVYMAQVERREFELGESNLFTVFQREQFAIEAAATEIDALSEYFDAQAEYAAALAEQFPEAPTGVTVPPPAPAAEP